MTLTLKYFAALRDQMGLTEEAVEKSAIGAAGQMHSTDTLVAWLSARDPRAEALQHPSVRIIVNDEIVPRGTALRDGDVVAFCPPFSGG